MRFNFRPPSNRRWLFFSEVRRFFFACALLLGVALPARGDNPPASEAGMKAVALLNFPKYVDWPDSAFERTNSPIIIAVFASDPVAAEMDKVMDRTFNGHPIEFRRITTMHDCDGKFHILFVGASGNRRMPDLLARLNDASVLTVGNSQEFLEKGGVIYLGWRDTAVHFEVNLAAARHAHLKISSKLLNLADRVKGKEIRP